VPFYTFEDRNQANPSQELVLLIKRSIHFTINNHISISLNEKYLKVNHFLIILIITKKKLRSDKRESREKMGEKEWETFERGCVWFWGLGCGGKRATVAAAERFLLCINLSYPKPTQQRNPSHGFFAYQKIRNHPSQLLNISEPVS